MLLIAGQPAAAGSDAEKRDTDADRRQAQLLGCNGMGELSASLRSAFGPWEDR
jgi:Asp/Glu/hydantoin racemase